jgi:uncharacterized cupredoxin-like copper-binding protein
LGIGELLNNLPKSCAGKTESGHMTLNLKPGTHELFCNAPGHYAMGQHTMFEVTG